MCGISGAMALEGELAPPIKDAIANMTRVLSHRGPDGHGFFADSVTALGHQRLAIIDRAGGAQPLSDLDGLAWVVFNGEIYNHHALRQKLLCRGHRFRTASDTEVLLHAYLEWGEHCLEQLEGMFAFAVYDRRRRELFAARDRLGKKPFFYAILDGALHFASEIKSLRQSPAWSPDLDLSSLEGYLSLGYFLAPSTPYRHVKKLEPGHWLRVRAGSMTTGKYWDVEVFDEDERDERSVLEDLESMLRSVVAERLESEVPLGAFLSGGIDSGLVVSLMAELMNEPPTTVSVGFTNSNHNELTSAGTTAEALATRHHAHVLEPRLHEVLDRIVGAFDEPFADSSAVPTFYVAQAAREHVTVALTGDGGDETFSGYEQRYVLHVAEAKMRAFVPGAPGRAAMRALGWAWPRSRALPRFLRLGTVLDNLGRDAADAYYADLCFFKPAAARALLGQPSSADPRASPIYDLVTAPYVACSSQSALQRAQYADLKVYLPNDVLVKVDRMSMQHGLEIRCPLLDRRLVEFAFRLPAERKMPHRETKHLLRSLARRRLPGDLWMLPKRGFTAPVSDWLAGPFACQLEDEVLGSGARIQTLLDQSVLRRLFTDHRSRSADHGYILWATWMLERWLRSERDLSTPRGPAV